MRYELFKKYLVIPLIIVTILGPIVAPFTEAFSFPDRYDLVAVLVEQSLYADTSDYDGLSQQAGGPVERTNLKRRIDRYATDIQNDLPGTRAVIIQVDRFEKPERVAAVLERLYFDGDPKEPQRTAYLRGVVVVGEVPLPVVNKQGTRFVSLFPYTDFEDKFYAWNDSTRDFEPRGAADAPQPEIWHGVIRPPVSTQSEEGRNLLASYLDKNHLYHIGDNTYATFNKRVFFQDFNEEAKNLNPLAYKNYLNFLQHQGDIAYLRYTKQLYKDLSGAVEEELADDEAEADSLQAELESAGIEFDSDVPPADIPADARDETDSASRTPVDKNAIPDIMTKIGKMSDKLMMRFNEIFTKYPSLINDFMKYTGRYLTPIGDNYSYGVDSAVNLITAKDTFTIAYLKEVNTMIENRIDELVNRAQKNIAFGSVRFEITSVGRRVENGIVDIEPDDIPPDPLRPHSLDPVNDPRACEVFNRQADFREPVNIGIIDKYAPPITFVNYSPGFSLDIFQLPCGENLIGREKWDFPNSINGYTLDEVTNVAQCTAYRGSRGAGRYSKLVEINRALDEHTAREFDGNAEAITGRTQREMREDYQCYGEVLAGECQGYEHFAGCFYDNSHLYDQPIVGSQSCFPDHATDPILDPAGTREITGSVIPGFDDYRACLNFRSKGQLIKHRVYADQRMEAVDDEYGESREDLVSQLDGVRVPPSDIHPDDIAIFTARSGDRFVVTLGDLLRGLGWNQRSDPLGWKNVLARFLMRESVDNRFIVRISHPKIAEVRVELSRERIKEISSVMQHKEPTTETLSAQTRSMISKDLPVDSPRYVTFQNQNGDPSRIVYPDIFPAQTLEEFTQQLRLQEADLAAFSECNGCLTALISPLPEASPLSRANASKVSDAIAWKNMDIDSKHAYFTAAYLDSQKNAYIGESLNGYELAYFNGEGDARRYTFSLNAAASGGELSELEGAGREQDVEAPYEDDPNNPFDDALRDGGRNEQGGYDLFSWSPPPISPWWQRMKEWSREQNEILEEYKFGQESEEFYAGLEEENAQALEEISRQNEEIYSKPASADSVALSRIASVVFESDAPIVGIGRVMTLRLSLKDAQNRPVRDEFARLTLELTQEGGDPAEAGGAARFVGADEDSNIPGHQVTVIGGRVAVPIEASQTPSRLTIRASVDGIDAQAQTVVRVVREAKLRLETPTLGIIADGRGRIAVNVTAVDENNAPIAQANGMVSVAVSDPLMAKIEEREISLRAGRGAFHVKAGTKKGRVVLNATFSHFDPGQLELTLLPGLPVRLELSSDQEKLSAEPGAQALITAYIVDAHGNIVDTAGAINVSLRLSEESQRFAQLSSEIVQAAGGSAQVRLLPTAESGRVTIRAESQGLRAATLTLDSVRQFGSAQLKNMQPESLAVALLGIPAGNVAENDFLGGWFVSRGKTQAVTTLTTAPKLNKKLFEITDRGGVNMPDPARIAASFVPANNFSMLLRDTQTGTDLATITIIPRRESEFAVITDEAVDSLADGIYIRKIGDDAALSVDRRRGALRVSKDNTDRFEIQTNGFTRIFDNNFSLRPKNSDFLVLEVLDRETVVAEVAIIQHFDQDAILTGAQTEPGVYVTPFTILPHTTFAPTFTGNSTSQPKGVAFYDTNEVIAGPAAPGFGFFSTEDSLDRFGVGFAEDNKFALAFSAGEMFGEANRAYSSDAGIILGDPTIRINNRTPGGFSQDIGKLIYPGSSEVRGLLPLDYNSDGFEDILIVEGAGRIRLIQNNGGYDQLKDQGYILNIKNGIQDFTKIDANNDRQMDLAIAAAESCRIGDTCIDVYENQRGEFVRRNLRFDQTEKIVTLRQRDLNNDGFSDLVFADTAGDVKVLYNNRGQFGDRPQLVGNVGLQVDPAKNLIDSVLLRYSGMPAKNNDDPESVLKYQALSLPEANAAAAAEGFAGFGLAGEAPGPAEPVQQYIERDFIYAKEDPAFGGSTKFGEDLNGGVLRTGDRVRYTITLRNDSAAVRTRLFVSDVIAQQLELDVSSIRCTDCAEGEMNSEALSGDATRPYLFKNIRVPARSNRHIVYEATYRGDTDSVEKITFIFSDRFSDSNAQLNALLRADRLPDMAVSKEGNPTGIVRYFYSTGVRADGTVTWGTSTSSPPDTSVSALEESTGLDFPDPEELQTSSDDEAPPLAATEQFLSMQEDDSDGDGLQNVIDDIEGGLDQLADVTQGVVNKLTCDAGCVAMPLNYAFLVPGFASLYGTPTVYDIGMPVFGWGVPSLIPVWPPSGPGQFAPLGGRFYISPTLTGGLGFSVCFGPFGTPRNCFSAGINPVDLLPGNICDKINGAVGAAMSVANSAISEANEGVTLSLGGSGAGVVGGASRNPAGSGLGNYSLGSYDSNISRSRNIRIPGFPSVLTNWWSAQVEEIVDKLDLPDLYIIYPSFDSLAAAVQPTDFVKTGDIITDALGVVNSIPLIDIETQQVLFKIPALTRNEIELFIADALQWVRDERLELDKWRTLLGCIGVAQAIDAAAGRELARPDNFGNLELCRFVTVEMNKLMETVIENVKRLDEWILFPKKILQFRSIESFYVNQIIDYLDTIIEYLGGWVKKNTARVKQWRAAVRKMKDVIENWKALINLMIDYHESCDNCKTERYGLKELILKLFMAIPSPPVIPLPKLPDLIIDVSKVQAGLRILWPDIQFKPEPFVLPRLPRIALGINLSIPLFKIMVPDIPVIPPPPLLPTLPSLPPLNLPRLPSLPPPPTLPGLPVQIEGVINILKKIVKILCIIRLGFTWTDEFLLKARIEEITARGLMPVLPVDLLFTVQTPVISITYVDQLILTAFTNFQLELGFIQRAVEGAASKANEFSTGLVKGVNNYTQSLSKELEKVTNPTINIGVPGPEGRELNQLPQELLDASRQLSALFGSLQTVRSKYRKINDATPDSITMHMATETFVPSKNGKIGAANIGVQEAAALPLLQKLSAYRDGLLAYTADQERMAEGAAATPAFGDLHRMIASQPFSRFLPATNFKKFLASTDEKVATDSRAMSAKSNTLKFGELDFESAPSRRIVQVPGQPGMPGGGGPAQTGSVNNVGIYYIGPDGNSRRLINYTLEAASASQLADIDIDNDGDKEKIYSYGSNVFLKKNERSAPEENRETFRPADIEFWTIFELLPKASSPSFPKNTSETAREANLTFAPSVAFSGATAGFEIIAKNSPFFFEDAGRHEIKRIHLLPEQNTDASAQISFELSEPDGEITINNSAPITNSAEAGDLIRTGENSSLNLIASDGTILRLSEKTEFVLSVGSTFTLLGGNLEVMMPQNGSAVIQPGSLVEASRGELRLRFFDGSEVTVTGGTSFTVPEFRAVIATVRRLNGTVLFTGRKREYVSRRAGIIHLASGDIIHPLEIARIAWNSGTQGERDLTLSPRIVLPVPATFSSGIDVLVEEGMIEIIRAEAATQRAAAGQALMFDDVLKVQDGALTVHYESGGETLVGSRETYSLHTLDDMSNPTAHLGLDPAFYFAKIYAFDERGNRSTASEKLLLSPQVCGDESAPFANFGAVQFTVAVGKTLTLDASRSFDTNGRVLSYNLDTDTATDSNGDGVADNDRDLFTDTGPNVDTDEDGNSANDGDSAQFIIGPYQQVGTKNMRLIVRDEGRNEGHQDITVEVVTPRIILEEPPLRSNVISGYVEPPEAAVPITIARKRGGQAGGGWELLRTPSANEGGQYFTDAEGRFRIEDADFRSRLEVRNEEGKTVAEIDEKTGRITPLDEKYETRVIPGNPPNAPMSVGLFLKNEEGLNNPLTFAYMVPDVNTDTTIDSANTVYDSAAVGSMSGVHVKPISAAERLGIIFSILPGDDRQLPGATVGTLAATSKRLVAIDVNGDIFISDPAISVREKRIENVAADAPVVFEILYNNEPIAEVYIATRSAVPSPSVLTIVNAPAPIARPKPIIPPSSAAPKKQPFSDIAAGNPFNETAQKLFERGIIAGYPSTVAGELEYRPQNLINRAEFTQIALKMLCIIPREEAHKLPSPFYDVLDPNLWFYPVLKEGNIRGFIKGYLGEKQIDAATGEVRTPFKPANTITRAEAATIVLAALNEQNIIDLSKADLRQVAGGKWYEPYVRIAQDLRPYLVDPGDEQRAFLLTPPEALAPDTQITRREFAIMAERVLLMHDCYNPDRDEDGLSDIWELTFAPSVDQINPDDDLDGDSCDNAREFELRTDPKKADTDGGGVNDCREIELNTNPVDNPYDDREQDIDGGGGTSAGAQEGGQVGPPSAGAVSDVALPPGAPSSEEGVYVVRPYCGDVCPCRARLESGASLQTDDLIFAAITGSNGVPIYAKSNEAEY